MVRIKLEKKHIIKQMHSHIVFSFLLIYFELKCFWDNHVSEVDFKNTDSLISRKALILIFGQLIGTFMTYLMTYWVVAKATLSHYTDRESLLT